MLPVQLVWAQARNGVIGAGNKLPWDLPEDLEFFKAQTMGDTVIMGRLTWDSLPEKSRPLPGRRNIVITRQNDWEAPGAEPAPSVEEAIRMARCHGEPRMHAQGLIWVIGGGSIYRQALPLASFISATVIDIEPAGDTFAPALPDWKLERGQWERSKTGLRYRHDILTRDQRDSRTRTAADDTRVKATADAAAARTSSRETAGAAAASSNDGAASSAGSASVAVEKSEPLCAACDGSLARASDW